MEGCHLFVWKTCAFAAKIQDHKLHLKWTPLKQSTPQVASPEPNTSFHGAVMDCHQDNNLSTFLHLNDEKDFRLLASGFSYDPGQMTKIPVLVLGSKTCKTKAKSPLHQKGINCLIVCLNASINFAANEKETHFELMVKHAFHLRRKYENIWENGTIKDYVKIADFFTVILLEPTSKSVTIFSGSGTSMHTVFSADENTSNITKIEVADMFSNHMTHEIFLLISFLDDRHNKMYKCIRVTSKRVNLSSCTNECQDDDEDDSMPTPHIDLVPLQSLFDLEYCKVFSSVKIVILSSILDIADQPESYKSCVMASTKTGFALRFVNGLINSIMNLSDTFQNMDNFDTGVDFSNNDTKIVNLKWKLSEKTAFHTKSICLVIDWEREQVIRTWESVHFISLHTLHSGGKPLLFLVFNSSDDECDGDHLLQPSNILVFDSLSVSDSEDGSSSLSQIQRQASEDGETMTARPPSCAIDAVTALNKRYDTALKNSRSELESKESFLLETIKHLQKFLICPAVGNAVQDFLPGSGPPLVPLVGGSSNKGEQDGYSPAAVCSQVEGRKTGGATIRGRRRLQAPFRSYDPRDSPGYHIEAVDSPIMRTIGSLLVVCLTVRNISKESLRNLHIHLVPMEPTPGVLVECKIGYNHQQTSRSLAPGSQETASCWTDLSQLLASHNISLQVFVSYEIPHRRLSTKIESLQDKVKRHHLPDLQTIDYNCAKVTLSSQEQVEGLFSLENAVSSIREDEEAALSLTDVLALDSVQISTDLLITSVVSSLKCLDTKLTAHRDFLSIHGHPHTAKHFIYRSNLQLNLCRVTLLEQSSKWSAKVRLFTRTGDQAILMVKLLRLILPGDITFMPDVPSSPAALQKVCDGLQRQIQQEIVSLKSQLKQKDEFCDDVINVEIDKDSDKVSSKMSASSPTFHSKKVRRQHQQ